MTSRRSQYTRAKELYVCRQVVFNCIFFVVCSQVFRVVLRSAMRDRRRSAERCCRLFGGRHLHHRADARVPVRVEPPVEQGAEGRLARVRVHADGRQHRENARDRWPAVPGVHRGPHAVGSDRRRHGACQSLRREYTGTRNNHYLSTHVSRATRRPRDVLIIIDR